MVMIIFVATGCDDMLAPPFTWILRKGNVTVVGCVNSEYEWKMSCIGTKWIGSKSNCTNTVGSEGSQNKLPVLPSIP